MVEDAESHADYIQRRGRSVRAHSHADVPEAERQVKFTMFQGVRGFAFGGTLTISKVGGFMTARSPLEKHRELVVSLCKLARAANPKFTFTTIQVSKSFATALHSDANNLGPSLTTCLGTFSGGHLYVHGIGMVNVHERFYEFNGNVPHLTCPFKGDRYCIIFSPVSHTDSARRRISDICNLLASTGQSRDL